MWTLENIKTHLIVFLGPKMSQTVWMSILKCSKETPTETFTWSKISQWEKQISTGSYNWRISWSLQLETLRVENLSPVLIQTMSKDIDGQLKPAHKVIDVVDQAKRRTCVTLQRYNVEKPESSYAQVRLFAEEEGGREVSTKCSYEIISWRNYRSTWCNGFCRS